MASTPSSSALLGPAAHPPAPRHQRAPVDIGCVIRKILNAEKVEEFKMRECLTNRWKPSSKEDTPFSMKGTTKRYLGLQHSGSALAKKKGWKVLGACGAHCSP